MDAKPACAPPGRTLPEMTPSAAASARGTWHVRVSRDGDRYPLPFIEGDSAGHLAWTRTDAGLEVSVRRHGFRLLLWNEGMTDGRLGHSA